MSYYKAYAVAIGSLLTGAAVVHQIYKPDLVRKGLLADHDPSMHTPTLHISGNNNILSFLDLIYFLVT